MPDGFLQGDGTKRDAANESRARSNAAKLGSKPTTGVLGKPGNNAYGLVAQLRIRNTAGLSTILVAMRGCPHTWGIDLQILASTQPTARMTI